jgi:hypothetical protein
MLLEDLRPLAGCDGDGIVGNGRTGLCRRPSTNQLIRSPPVIPQLELAYLRLTQMTHHVYYGLFDTSARLCDLSADDRQAREFWKKKTDQGRCLAWKWPPCDITAVTRATL